AEQLLDGGEQWLRRRGRFLHRRGRDTGHRLHSWEEAGRDWPLQEQIVPSEKRQQKLCLEVRLPQYERSMDRFEAIRTFIAAVDGGSLSAASRMLSIPLPTVSRRVSDLEGLLGSQLLVRTSRKLLLTEAGAAYVAVARRVLEELAEAERAASGEY